MSYEIEMSEPSSARCDCCGGLTVRLTRFVHKDGDAYAVYYAAYANNHPESEIAMLISLGEWGEGAEPSQRVAFYCRVRPADSYEVMLGDAAQSGWGDVEIVGKKLSRAEALAHPWKAAAFEVLDEAFARDPSLQGYLHRVRCGDAATPLEKRYSAPDDVFARGGQAAGDFASLDGQRFFVRALLPVPVEGYGTWNVGVWVEVSKADHDRIYDAWDDARSYSALAFRGTLANDARTDPALPISLPDIVEVRAPDPDGLPQIVLGARPWPRAAFEAYAVARGFL